MAYSSTLDLDGTLYDVLGGDVGFSRSVDVKGRPSSHVMGGQLSFSVEITPKTTLVENMLNAQNKPIAKGMLKFTDAGDDSTVMREIDFENAYIVNYSESFSVSGSAYSCSITLSAEKITIKTAVLDQRWPKKS